MVHAADRRIAGVPWNDRTRRLGILGAAGLLLAVVIGIFAYNIYEERIGRPNTVILSVEGEDFTLRYYADRLGGFLKANNATSSTIQLLEEDLLNKLEREAVGVKLAAEKNVPLGNEDILNFIASQFGVQRGASGSSFDTLYRAQLRAQAVSDGTFKRLKTAELAESKLQDSIRTEIGDKGDQYVLRSVLAASKAAIPDTATTKGVIGADDILKRLQAGEDFGSIAQKESLDLASRQQDGLMLPEPIELLPAAIQAALKDKKIGELLGPVQVQDKWWVFKIERVEPVDYSANQKTDLGKIRLDALINQTRSTLRAAGKIKSSLSASDITWAQNNASVPTP